MITIRHVSTKLAKQLPPSRTVIPAAQQVCLSLGFRQDRSFSKSSGNNPTLQEKALDVLLNHTKTSDGGGGGGSNRNQDKLKNDTKAAAPTPSQSKGGDDVNGHQANQKEFQ